jgi:hypothetical protein
LGLRGKLFGATADAPLLWRCADAVVARPQSQTLARALLLGTPLIAIVDDAAAPMAAQSSALTARRAGTSINSVLLVSGALESLFASSPGRAPLPDGAANAADAIAIVAEQKRAVSEERRAASVAATRERARSVTAAAASVAAATAAPGELEDLSGGLGDVGGLDDLPDASEIDRLRSEMQGRLSELSKAMMQARTAADRASVAAADAKKRNDAAAASAADRQGDAERARMHSLLGEMATLEREITQLGEASKTAARSASSGARAAASGPPPRNRIDDELSALKARSATAGGNPRPIQPPKPGRPAATVDDELQALKRKMAAGAAPGKKK